MAICYRIFITLTNIFFPPLAVIFLTGFGLDTFINAFVSLPSPMPYISFPPMPPQKQNKNIKKINNQATSLLFLAAIIPSHIHGFYLSCTYFHRRRKVRKGRYPGGPKPLIYSENVLFGGARWDEVQQLKRREDEENGRGGDNTNVELAEKRQRRASRRESRRMHRAAHGGSSASVGGGSVSSPAGSGTGGGGGGYDGLRYGLGDGAAAGYNASNGVVGPGYGPGYGPSGAFRGTLRRVRTAY